MRSELLLRSKVADLSSNKVPLKSSFFVAEG